MKKVFLSAAAACLLLCTGCGESSVLPFEKRPIQQKTTALTTAAEDTAPEVTTDELDRRIGVIYDLEPVPVPADGWTDETLLPTICIGGECGKLPFCLADLLYGCKLTGEHADYYAAHADEVFCDSLSLTSSECIMNQCCGDLEFLPRTETANAAYPEGVLDRQIDLVPDWGVVCGDGSTRMPVSFNTICIGSPFGDVVQYLGFGEGDRAPGENETFPQFTVHVHTEHISIVLIGTDAVDSIMVNISDTD